jgi:ABC-type lipoprotein release transport system permease subunit
MNAWRSRALSLLAFALGSLHRRRGRALATVVGLTVVATAFGAVFSLTDALRGEARRASAAAPDLAISRLRAGRPALMSTREAERVRALTGVGAVRPRVWGYLYLDALSATVVVVGLGEGERALLGPSVIEGSLSDAGGRGWVLLGDAVHRAFGARIGDELDLGGRTFTVRARARRATSAVSADAVVMDARDARVLLAMAEDEASDLAVHVPNPDEVETVATKVSEALPGARVVSRESVARAYELTYGARGGFVTLALLPALLALLVLVWDRLTGLSPDERREIAVLKAIGWSTGDVLAVRLWESAIVGGAAVTLATGLAHGYVFVLGAPGLLDALRGWSALRPAIALAPSGDGASALAVVSVAVVPWLVASVVPAWRAAVTDPAEALR